MTVQELIEELEKVEDKFLPVRIYDGNIEAGVEVDENDTEVVIW